MIASAITMLDHKLIKPLIPLPRRLLQPIERFLQQADLVFLSSDFKTLRLLHQNLLFKLTIQECRLDIDLLQLHIMIIHKCQNQPN